jgi:hypothetical protein
VRSELAGASAPAFFSGKERIVKISQREARRLKRRVKELEESRRAVMRSWASDFPSGVHICSMTAGRDGLVHTAIRTAQRLGHAVIVTTDGDGKLYFYANKP